MPEAVIVAAARSPIGRAFKGSLRTSCAPTTSPRPIVRAALDQVPELDPAAIDDLLLGCGQPAGEQGFNLARVVAVLLGLDRVPATTVTGTAPRQPADHPDGDARDPGRRGRRVRLRRRRDGVAGTSRGKSRRLPDTRQPRVRRREARSATARPARARRGPTRARTACCRTSTSRWARPRRTSPRCAASPAQTQDEFAVRSARTWPRRRSPTASGPARSPR